MIEHEYGYAAFEKCGCMTGAVVDMADADTAKDVADFIKSGRRVERMTIDEINAIGFGCKCAEDQPSLFNLKGGENG